jgi:hypothetical protein
MRRFLQAVLLFSYISLLFVSCTSLHRQGYSKVKANDYEFNPVFGTDFIKTLYTAEITFGKNTFTSLAIIKHMPAYKSYRLVFFSEAGLQLMGMEFLDNGNVNVEYMSDFLNRKAIVKKLSADFKLLFIDNTHHINKAYAMPGDSGTYILQMKGEKSANYYFFSNAKEPFKIRERGCNYGKSTVLLNHFENGGPNYIQFTHKMLKLTITMTKIDYPEWN